MIRFLSIIKTYAAVTHPDAYIQKECANVKRTKSSKAAKTLFVSTDTMSKNLRILRRNDGASPIVRYDVDKHIRMTLSMKTRILRINDNKE